MLTDHSRQLLETAAADSLERIRLDRARAPQRLKPLLAYIEDNLFDSTLDVNQLKRSCGVRDNSVPIQFHSAVGRPPHGYIEDRRLETACSLLSNTNLKIWQISELLGYSSIQVFSRAFSRWSGQRPTQFRKKARMENARGDMRNGKSADQHYFFGPDSIRKALSGELSQDEAQALVGRLLKLYPGCRGMAERGPSREQSDSSDSRSKEDDPRPFESCRELDIHIATGDIDRLRAEELLRELEELPPARQEALIDEIQLGSATLFHLLCERSRDLSRELPRRGVEMAELALRCLEPLTNQIDRASLASFRAQGHAWLANAQLAAMDRTAAERELEEARAQLEGSNGEPSATGDVRLVEAALRREQHRFEEAHQLLEAASEVYESGGNRDRLTAVRIARAALHSEEHRPDKAIPCLERALEDVGRRDGVLRLTLLLRLMSLLLDAGRPSQAAELLGEAKQLALAYGDRHARVRLAWLEGVVHGHLGRFAEAESALIGAREGFVAIDKTIDAAIAVLDLAELYSRQGRLIELEGLAGTMSTLFERLQNDREALRALELVRQAAQERSVTRSLLEEARQALHGGSWRLAA